MVKKQIGLCKEEIVRLFGSDQQLPEDELKAIKAGRIDLDKSFGDYFENYTSTSDYQFGTLAICFGSEEMALRVVPACLFAALDWLESDGAGGDLDLLLEMAVVEEFYQAKYLQTSPLVIALSAEQKALLANVVSLVLPTVILKGSERDVVSLRQFQLRLANDVSM